MVMDAPMAALCRPAGEASTRGAGGPDGGGWYAGGGAARGGGTGSGTAPGAATPRGGAGASSVRVLFHNGDFLPK